MARRFAHPLRVRYAECDAQGAVFNANYVMYFDVAITELWREAIGPYAELVARGVDMVVAEVNVRYRRPVRFDDAIEVAVEIERLGTTAVTSRMTVLRDGEPMAEGAIRHVFIDVASGAKTEIPGDIRAALEPYLMEQAA